MATIGHASPVAALRYQHATEERGRELADYMDNIITSASTDEPPTAGVVRMGSPKARRDVRGMRAPAQT